MSATLPVVRAAELDQEPEDHRWLIEGIWGRAAIGLVGGPPKCCKTWYGLDMAVSVASATKALGHFVTVAPGPALVYLAEDALPQVRARIEQLCRHRGLDIASLDLHVITTPVLRLDLSSDQERLASTVDALRPRLLLLDPLVRMHRLDENSAAEISGLLGYIRELQRRFDLAIALVHHASKKQRAQPGQALRGSSDLHAIGDSNAYLARKGEHIVLTLEHRAARSPEPVLLELVAGEEDDPTHLRVCGGVSSMPASVTGSLEQQVLTLLRRESRAMTRASIRERLRVNNKRLGDTLLQLQTQGRVHRDTDGWTAPMRLPGETEAGSAGVQPAEG